MTVHVQPVRLEACPALVLNADYRPLSYYPLSIWCWQDAIKAVFLDRVNIVSEYDRTVRSPSFEIRLPSVVSLKTYVQPSRQPAFTRFNVFLRDRFTCQYCGDREDLTFDHLIPRSKGGHTTWDNVVTACSPCNLRKGDRLARQVDMAAADALRADPPRSAPERPAVPAELPARKLDGLPLLGYGTRAVVAPAARARARHPRAERSEDPRTSLRTRRPFRHEMVGSSPTMTQSERARARSGRSIRPATGPGTAMPPPCS